MNTILLVEDEADNQLVIEDMFEFDDIGAELVIVEDAEEAVMKATELQPLLVIMDIRLPGISGLDAAEILKKNEATSHIPIWAITAHAMQEDKYKALEAGCDDYITKPIDAAELAQRLRGFVSAAA